MMVTYMWFKDTYIQTKYKEKEILIKRTDMDTILVYQN